MVLVVNHEEKALDGLSPLPTEILPVDPSILPSHPSLIPSFPHNSHLEVIWGWETDKGGIETKKIGSWSFKLLRI